MKYIRELPSFTAAWDKQGLTDMDAIQMKMAVQQFVNEHTPNGQYVDEQIEIMLNTKTVRVNFEYAKNTPVYLKQLFTD